MSATLLIVIPEMHVDLPTLRGSLEPNFVVSGDLKSLTVGQIGAREKVFVVQVTDFISEGIYEDWPDEQVPSVAASVFSLDYVSPELVFEIAQTLARHFDAIVDTNFGKVKSLGELTISDLPQGLA